MILKYFCEILYSLHVWTLIDNFIGLRVCRRSLLFRYIPGNNPLDFCSQEATAEDVEFDDEEVGPDEVDDTKDYWVHRTELC